MGTDEEIARDLESMIARSVCPTDRENAASITSPYAPDLEQVRAWLKKMITAVKFVELVAAVLSLLGRMRDINTELTKQLAHLRRARPRSETLERLQRQLVLPLVPVLAATAARPADALPRKRRRVVRADIPDARRCPRTSSACG